MSDIHSMPYRPTMACERCVFGTGKHAEWCDAPDQADPVIVRIYPGGRWKDVSNKPPTRYHQRMSDLYPPEDPYPPDPYMADILKAGRDL